MIKVIRVTLKKSAKAEETKKVIAQYRYIKELALMKYHSEKARE